MKKIIFLLIFISSANLLRSQSTERFVRLYDEDPVYLWTRNVMVTDSNYILAGNSYDPNNQNHSEITILFFDKYGNFQSQKTYGDTTYFFVPITPYGNTLHKDHSGHYYLFYDKSNWDYTENYNYTVKFNAQFDTLWTHQTYAGGDPSKFGLDNGVIDTLGNIYIVGGSSITENGDTLTGHTCLYVEKLDSMGNHIWLHTYEIGHSYADNAVIDPQTNHLWIGGVSELNPGVYEISPDGQLLWFHTFEVPFFIGTAPAFVSVLPGNPGTILASGCLLWTSDASSGFSSIIRNQQVVNHWYYESDYYNTLHSISAKPLLVMTDSTFLIVEGLEEHFADTFLNYNTLYRRIFKFDLNGNVLWRRNFYIPNVETYPNLHHNIYDITRTDDGGFFATGWLIDTNSVYSAILAKFDSLGCDGYHSCADTAMVLDILTPLDTVCSDDTLWMNFHLDGLSAPYTFTTSMGDTISNIYHAKDSIYLHAYNPNYGLSEDDSTQYISYDIYVNYPFIPETIWNDTLIQLQVTLTGHYGRTITHTYDIPVKDCSVGIVQPEIAQLKVFPNPATGGVVNIEATLNEPAFLSLYDNTGKSLQTMRLESGTHVYQIKQQLPEGIYFVSIWNEQGSVVKKFVKE